MEWLTGNLFETIVSVLLGAGGVSAIIGKFVLKIPITKIKQGLSIARQLFDVLDELQAATDENGDGGKDITKEEAQSIYREIREAGKAVGEIRKTFNIRK